MRLKNMIRTASYIVISAVLLIGYNNCGKSKKDDSQSSEGFQQQLSAEPCENQLMMFFDRSYHSFLKTNCASCHSNGPGKGQFANNDVTVAYKDFMQVGYSKVSSNAISDGHNPPYSGSHHTQTINDLRVTWVQALSEYDICKGGTGSVDDTLSLKDRAHFALPKIKVPALNDNEEKRIEYNLASDIMALKGDNIPNLAGAKMSFMIRKEVKGTLKYYAVHSPRIYNGQDDIHIKGIFTKINGRYIQHSTNFRFVDKSIPKSVMENSTSSLVSTGAVTIPGAMSVDDEVSFDLEKLETTVIPPPPPPVIVSFTSASVVKADSSGLVTVQIALDRATTEPISYTIEADASPLCGGTTDTVTLNNSTCLPAAYSLLCPGGGCSTTVTNVTKARSVVGTTYNRFDWDYQFTQSSGLFSIGETSKQIQIKTSKDIRYEANRILTLKITIGLGNASVGSNSQVHIVFDKRQNPIPGPTDITYSKLMNPTNGILLYKCGNCHNSNPSQQQGGYDIANYDLMVSQGVLKPGQDHASDDGNGNVVKTYASKLFKRMNSQDPDSGTYLTPMPRDKYLDYDTEISFVERWILNGALNN